MWISVSMSRVFIIFNALHWLSHGKKIRKLFNKNTQDAMLDHCCDRVTRYMFFPIFLDASHHKWSQLLLKFILPVQLMKLNGFYPCFVYSASTLPPKVFRKKCWWKVFICSEDNTSARNETFFASMIQFSARLREYFYHHQKHFGLVGLPIR